MNETPTAFLVILDWPEPEYTNNTKEQVAAIKEAIECICGVEEVRELFKGIHIDSPMNPRDDLTHPAEK